MDDTDNQQAALPPGIELAWGLRARPGRGPKPGLALDQVVAAGMLVARTEGLDSLSMARVASALGVATMSLYRYVASKDELLTLMVDTALGAPPADRVPGESWRAGLTRWSVGMRAAYRRDTWVLRVPINAPPLAPNNVAWLEHALSCLVDTPLTEQQKLSTVLLLSGFVRNESTLLADFAAASTGDVALPTYVETLAALIDPVRFPAVQRAIDSGSLGDDDDLDVEFDFGLERILDGIDVLIARVGSARPGSARKSRPRA